MPAAVPIITAIGTMATGAGMLGAGFTPTKTTTQYPYLPQETKDFLAKLGAAPSRVSAYQYTPAEFSALLGEVPSISMPELPTAEALTGDIGTRLTRQLTPEFIKYGMGSSTTAAQAISTAAAEAMTPRLLQLEQMRQTRAGMPLEAAKTYLPSILGVEAGKMGWAEFGQGEAQKGYEDWLDAQTKILTGGYKTPETTVSRGK